MAKHYNISGELVQQLVVPGFGSNYRVSKVSLTNVQKVSKCKVDLYVEKENIGKVYLIKNIELPIGATLVYDGVGFNSTKDEYGLFIKLTNGSSFDITGSINPDGSNPADGSGTKFLSELSVGDTLKVNSETKTITALLTDTTATMDTAFSAGSADTTVQCNPTALVDVIIN